MRKLTDKQLPAIFNVNSIKISSVQSHNIRQISIQFSFSIEEQLNFLEINLFIAELNNGLKSWVYAEIF